MEIEYADRFLYGLRSDSVLLIVLLLDLTSAVRLVDGGPHGIGNGIRIHDHMAFGVSRQHVSRLDQDVSNESFLIHAPGSYKCDLRDIKSLSEEVDSHKNIKDIQTHIADDLGALQCVDIRVQIFYADPGFPDIIRKVCPL